MFGFLRNIGTTELIIIAAIGVLIFGSKAFISLGKAGGQTFKEIKNIKKNFTDAVEDGSDEEENK